VYEVASRLALLAGQGLGRIFVSGKYRVGDIRHGTGSWAHAGRAMGYTPQVGLTEGLTRLLAWMREQDLAAIPAGIDSVAEMEMRERGLFGKGLLQDEGKV
jgi:dTDP-L-rhamnose 4-epimerase